MRLIAELVLPREPASLARARHVIETLLGLSATATGCRGELAVLMTEACSNAVRHSDGGVIDLSVDIHGDRCVIEIGNCGPQLTGPVLDSPIADPLSHGGRGLPIIAALADTAEFLAVPPGNVRLRIIKHLVPGTG